MSSMEDTRIRRQLEERIGVLQQVCAETYELAGAVGAPEKALDNLAAAADGRPIPHATFLPVSAADCDEFGEDRDGPRQPTPDSDFRRPIARIVEPEGWLGPRMDHNRGSEWAVLLGALALGSAVIVTILSSLTWVDTREVWKNHRRPEPVGSPGGIRVERQVGDGLLTARRRLEVVEEPQRELLFPMFWRHGAPAGHLERGETVRVLGVKETYLWRERLVWLELQRTTDPDNMETVWQLVGNQLFASSRLRTDWTRTEADTTAQNQ